MHITALAGGTGAAKLLRGLARLLDPRELTVVVNTGDDAEVWGLHVSPDLDTVCYTLGGVIDEHKGWGLTGETFHTLDQIARFGEPVWFNLGDRDLATHLHRTRLLREGRALSDVTRAVAAALGVASVVLPMSDQPVRTRILGPDGWLAFQEYFVRDRAAGDVVGVEYIGAPLARPAPGVLGAIAEADLVVVCPSNPVTSVGPILAVPGIAAALGAARTVVAVSPIVAGAPVSGPAGRLMQARGLQVSPLGVATAYAPWLRALLIDPRDGEAGPGLERAGVHAVVADVMMPDPAREVALARRVLEAA